MPTANAVINAKLKAIEALIEIGAIGDAYGAIDQCEASSAQEASLLCYLRGKAKMKESAWGEAMTAFLQSEQHWEESPAKAARQMLEEILNFYDKQVYGQ